MNLTLTPTATYDSVDVPVPLDPVRAGATATTGSVRPAYVALANRDEYMRAAVEQVMEDSFVRRAKLWVRPDVALVRSLGRIALWSDAAATETVSAVHNNTSVNVAGLTVATWYHFYVYWDSVGSSIAQEASTVQPETVETLSYKTGDPSRKYVGSAYVYDSGGGVPLFVPFTQIGGHAVLDGDMGPGTVTEVLAASSGTGSWSGAVSCVGKIPPNVLIVDMYGTAELLEAGGGAQGPAALLVRRHGSTQYRPICQVNKVGVGGQTDAANIIQLPLDSNQRFNWKFDAPVGGNAAVTRLAVVGWYF